MRSIAWKLAWIRVFYEICWHQTPGDSLGLLNSELLKAKALYFSLNNQIITSREEIDQ